MMGTQIMINSYFVTAVSLIEQNPELGFAASDWAWPRFLLRSFVIWVAEESYHVIRSGQSDSMTNGPLHNCFADSHEHYLEFVLMFGLIRSQNKCGIYHFRLASRLILQALQDVWYILDLENRRVERQQCPMTLPSALNMSYSQNIQNIPTYLW